LPRDFLKGFQGGFKTFYSDFNGKGSPSKAKGGFYYFPGFPNWLLGEKTLG